MKLTEWFGPDVKPVMPGVYETNVSKGAYQMWDGKRWGSLAQSPDKALYDNYTASFYQEVKWRGLAEKP